MRTHAKVLRALVGCALLGAGACRGGSTAAFPVSGYSPDVREGVARVREATNRFHSLDSAVAAGYPRESAQCYANGAEGAMGFHHVNRDYVDARLDLDHPEILIYERLPDGRYVLNGVEFIIPYTRWPADSTAPVLLGQRLKSYDDLRIWSVHMWVWKENPSGLFADWNPAVHCLIPAAHLAH
jgi:hypothetical protein